MPFLIRKHCEMVPPPVVPKLCGAMAPTLPGPWPQPMGTAVAALTEVNAVPPSFVAMTAVLLPLAYTRMASGGMFSADGRPPRRRSVGGDGRPDSVLTDVLTVASARS